MRSELLQRNGGEYNIGKELLIGFGEDIHSRKLGECERAGGFDEERDHCTWLAMLTSV
jgi:hypothetical protein